MALKSSNSETKIEIRVAPQVSDGSEGETGEPQDSLPVSDQPYELLSVLAKSSSSTVYHARHVRLDKPVAIKLFSTALTQRSERQQFQGTAQESTLLDHPHIAPVYDFGFWQDERPYFVMQEVKGQTLAELLRAAPKTGVERDRILKIFIQVCDALEYAFAKRAAVGDLTPANVVICDDAAGDMVKVVGIATKATHTEAAAGDAGIPERNALPYASPERCVGDQVDERSAIYSIGCMMYESLTGQPPFDLDNPIQTIFKHANERPKRFSHPGRQIDRKLEQIVLRCLEKKPSDRPSMFSELRRELADRLAGKASKHYRPVDMPQMNKFVEAFILICSMIAIAAIMGAQQIKTYQHHLNSLRTTITQAVLAGEEFVLNTDTQSHLWEKALAQAKALCQPPEVIADLHMQLGDAYCLASDSRSSDEFLSAASLYRKERLNYEEMQALDRYCSQYIYLFDTSGSLYETFSERDARALLRPLSRLVFLERILRGSQNGSLWEWERELAMIYTWQGNYNLSTPILKKLADRSAVEAPDAQTFRIYGDCLRRQGQLSEAENWYQKACRASASQPYDLGNIARELIQIQEQRGDLQGAAKTRKQFALALSTLNGNAYGLIKPQHQPQVIWGPPVGGYLKPPAGNDAFADAAGR